MIFGAATRLRVRARAAQSSPSTVAGLPILA